MNHCFITVTAALVLLALAACGTSGPAAPTTPAKVKIGFLVKQPEEPWFQQEWKFADAAAAQGGFEYVLLLGIVMFAIAIRGGGPYSLDRAIGKEL